MGEKKAYDISLFGSGELDRKALTLNDYKNDSKYIPENLPKYKLIPNSLNKLAEIGFEYRMRTAYKFENVSNSYIDENDVKKITSLLNKLELPYKIEEEKN